MPATQADKAARFQALHHGPGGFVIANAWDAGSAKILTGLGFVALATSSGAAAAVLGRRDGMITRDEALAHCRAIVDATDLPISADLEKGFGDAPEAAAETIRLAGTAGLVGGSIEDASGNPAKPLFDVGPRNRARRRGGCGGTRSSLQIRADRASPKISCVANRTWMTPSRRLQAFEAAGADVLMAPGLPDLAAVRAVCGALSRPFNFMAGIKGKSFSVAALTEAGVKRVSLATSLYKAAMTGLVNAAREAKEHGTLTYIDAVMTTPELNAFLGG